VAASGRARPPGAGDPCIDVLRLGGAPAAAHPRDIEEVWLTEQIERIHKDSGETYGSLKVHAQLRREGIRVSRKRVERLMRQAGLQGAFVRKRKRSSTRRDPAATPAADLVNRQFTAPAPNQLWVADISRIPTGQGPLWLASVRDAFSRRVVGWKASDRADTELVLGALESALWSRQVERDRLVFHSDHGRPVHRDPVHPAP
jgi:putative transposase